MNRHVRGRDHAVHRRHVLPGPLLTHEIDAQGSEPRSKCCRGGGRALVVAFGKLDHEKEGVWVEGWGARMKQPFSGAEKDVKEPSPVSDRCHHVEVTHAGTPHFAH